VPLKKRQSNGEHHSSIYLMLSCLLQPQDVDPSVLNLVAHPPYILTAWRRPSATAWSLRPVWGQNYFSFRSPCSEGPRGRDVCCAYCLERDFLYGL